MQLDIPTAATGVSGEERVRPVPKRKDDLIHAVPSKVFDNSLYDRPASNWQHLLGGGKRERPEPCANSADQYYGLHACARPERATNFERANLKVRPPANVMPLRYPTIPGWREC